AAIRNRSRRLALEINNHKIGCCAKYLAKMIVSVDSSPHRMNRLTQRRTESAPDCLLLFRQFNRFALLILRKSPGLVSKQAEHSGHQIDDGLLQISLELHRKRLWNECGIARLGGQGQMHLGCSLAE